jgi:hypothetical protein
MPLSQKAFRSRYKRAQNIDIEPSIGPESAKQEYAIERRLLEAPVFELSYYTDVVGVVPVEPCSVENEGLDIGNGDASPEWGLDLVVHGGFLRYGPWADRQRRVPSSHLAESILLTGGYIGSNCSAYSSHRHTMTQNQRTASSMAIIVCGLLCGYLSSFVTAQRYTYLSAKPRRYLVINFVSMTIVLNAR